MTVKRSSAEHAAIKQFGNELKRLRELSDMSQKELGDRIGVSKQQVGAVERGVRKPSKQFAELTDVALECHGSLRNLWPGARQTQPWWLQEFVELEAKAQVIYEFHPQAVPGLLQTKGYACALVDAAFPPLLQHEKDQVITARFERQKILNQNAPPLTLFVIDEAALRRPVGGEQVMEEQLRALLAVACKPRVQIQVLPFARGAHSAMNGPLVILNMAHAESLVYAETPGSGQVITDPGVVANCVEQFGDLRGVSLSPVESLRFIASLGGEGT
ncbi:MULTISPECIES: helix-turn-helix domain-containing protein [Nocardiopsidaceae]|uniref:Helix-turn-helix transcriptional regulator n=1 Tax=Streptomonospora nanhaiensis TaxID=1323731 RepID=A0ABY6YHA6_9ACTN|nr:helix-turn-helix transcriptional regulator [Streptomonospora nanhaiensis]WAE71662.1 helix-turn-helix transcriptional regulator [Streptomonospora nanhaiensis]